VTRPNLPDTFSRQQAAMQLQIDQITRFSQLGNSTITDGALLILDANGTVRVSMGQYVWPSAPHAGVTVNGLVIFDGSGNPVLVNGVLPDGTYALAAYDSLGRERTRIGALTSGDYGLQVTDTAGNGREVLPVYDISGAGPYTVASMTATSLVSGTAPVGMSGQAYVTLTATLAATSSSGLNATVSLYVDGVATSLQMPVGNNGPTGVAELSLSGRTLLTGMSTGSHTFAVYIQLSTTPETVQITNIAVQVEPI
jgi:hypothetical protein